MLTDTSNVVLMLTDTSNVVLMLTYTSNVILMLTDTSNVVLMLTYTSNVVLMLTSMILYRRIPQTHPEYNTRQYCLCNSLLLYTLIYNLMSFRLRKLPETNI